MVFELPLFYKIEWGDWEEVLWRDIDQDCAMKGMLNFVAMK